MDELTSTFVNESRDQLLDTLAARSNASAIRPPAGAKSSSAEP